MVQRTDWKNGSWYSCKNMLCSWLYSCWNNKIWYCLMLIFINLNPWNSLLVVLKSPEIMRCFMHFSFLSCSPVRYNFSSPSPRPPSPREGGDFRGRRQACCALLPPGWNKNPEGFKKRFNSISRIQVWIKNWSGNKICFLSVQGKELAIT